MRRFPFFGLLWFILFSSTELKAQFNLQQPPILPQAPNTATLGKFGDYGVSFFSGVPQISIPLYTIKTSGFEVPITLVYHASGIKLYEFPSWVGTGWALDAGGQIQRRLVGKSDEVANGFLSGDPWKAENIDPSYNNDYPYVMDQLNGYRDNGADIFSYSFPGGGGKFFFDKDNNYQPVFMPYAPLSIKHSGALQSLNFDVQDVQGNKFEFGKSYAEVTNSIASGGNPNWQESAWMLEKMIAAGKEDTILFTYQSQFDHTPWERIDTWTVNDKSESISSDPNPYTSTEGTFSSSFSSSDMFSFNHQEIRFKNGKVVFEVDPIRRQDFGQTDNSKALKKIKVYSTSPQGDKLLKTFIFFNSYFINGTDEYSKRLRLDSVQEVDAGNVVVDTYRFEYNTTTNLPKLDAETVSKDYWGYYNGRSYNSSNNTLVPKTTISYQATNTSTPTTVTIGSSTDGSREPDSVYMQAAILKRIYYPTKGYTDFEYETNRHLDENNNIKLAGGLRVKSIKSYDGISSIPIVKTYKYGFDESGVGRANYFIGNYFFYDEQKVEYWTRYDPDNMGINTPYLVAKERRRIFYSNPTIDIETYDATPVVYPYVTEYSGEGSNVLGKTVYQFRDTADGISVIDNSSKAQVVSHFYDRGQLLNKRIFKKTASGQFQPVAEERNNYNTSSFAGTTKFGGLLLKQQILRENISDYEPSFTSQDWYYNNFYITSDDNYPTSTTSITYDAEDTTKYTQTVTAIGYGNIRHQQPTTTTTTNSKNETLTTRTKFPADYIASGNSVTGNAILDSMLAKNMNAVEIEKWLTLTKPSESGKVTGGQLNAFKRLGNGLIVPDQQSRLLVSTPLSDYQVSSISSGSLQRDSRYEPLINYNLFDSRGNILEVQKASDVNESYLWSYNGAYPVAKITGADFNTVKQYVDTALLYAPATTEAQIRSQLTTLRNALTSHQLITTYTYKPLVGMTSATDASGKVTYYEYDASGRLFIIRDQNNKILKKICYNYAGQPGNCTVFANVQKSGSFTKASCEGGATGGSVTYTVPASTYFSAVSQAEADQLAQDDVNANGQAYANSHGSCTFYSVVKSGTFTRSCGTGYTGSTVTYTVPAGTYSSTISQAAADALAQNDVNNNGQSYANSNGTCTAFCSNCSGDDKKCINGSCETGLKVYTYSYYDEVKGYVCVYHYEWSDSSWSVDYEEYSSWGYPCFI